MLITLLNIVAPIAITVFVIGIGLRLGRFVMALLTKRRFR